MMEGLLAFFLDPLGPKGARGPPGEVLGDVSGCECQQNSCE